MAVRRFLGSRPHYPCLPKIGILSQQVPARLRSHSLMTFSPPAHQSSHSYSYHTLLPPLPPLPFFPPSHFRRGRRDEPTVDGDFSTRPHRSTFPSFLFAAGSDRSFAIFYTFGWGSVGWLSSLSTRVVCWLSLVCGIIGKRRKQNKLKEGFEVLVGKTVRLRCPIHPLPSRSKPSVARYSQPALPLLRYCRRSTSNLIRSFVRVEE